MTNDEKIFDLFNTELMETKLTVSGVNSATEFYFFPIDHDPKTDNWF